MKCCPACNKEISNSLKIFCNKVCYRNRKKFHTYKHSNETKNKIAIANSKKPFTKERKKAISIARTFVPASDLIEKLNDYWKLRYLNRRIIMELCGLSKNKSIYQRLFKQYCNYVQLEHMPINWYPQHYETLIKLGKQNVYYIDIAKTLGFGKKQVYCIAQKLCIKLNRKNPNAWSCVISKPELQVIDWIKNAGYKINTQFQLGNFLFDAHIVNTDILIEINGDYWHCNPKVYKNGPINEMQKAHMRRDFAKKACALQHGFKLITVWEFDIRNSKNNIHEWILKKVKEYDVRTNSNN